MRTPLSLVLVLTACGRDDPEPRAMVLEGIRPRDGQGLYLNEELVLTFSHEVDPTSVTDASLPIVSAQGHRARGEWVISGRVLRFVPRPVLRASLDDGGYLPGTRYVLEGVGFPRLDGLRSVEGRPLRRGFRWAFATVAVEPERPAVVFDDVSPDRAHPLLPDPAQLNRSGALLAPWEPLVLTCAEPLDPSSLRDGDFTLIGVAVDGEVELTAALRANHPEGSREVACQIELFPRELLPPGEYDLILRPVLGLVDFRGNPVPPGFSRLSVRVERPPHGAAPRRPTLAFLDTIQRSPLRVAGTDGLAHWDGGRVTVRYPAAAGTGEDGPLAHGHALTRPDLHASRVHLPAGEELRLLPGRGLRVLRSQHGLVLDGEVRRQLGLDVVPASPGEDQPTFLPGETLSEFLARAAAAGWDWTVLVAGGDLVVTGSLLVDTPLLLVAGGWIRVDGTLKHTPGQLWLLRDGGGAQDLSASVPDLVLDPPRLNPLREPLRVGVSSSAMPSAVRAYRWLGVDADGHAGAGRWTVRFLPPQGPVDRGCAVGHPRLLPSDGPLRVLIELEVSPAPGRAWDPPFVDYVDLRWEAVD